MQTVEGVVEKIAIPQHCDKCGERVAPDQNAYFLELLALPSLARFAPVPGADVDEIESQLSQGIGRHLFPLVEEGREVCEGSPARRFNVENRRSQLHPEYSQAFQKLQHLANPTPVDSESER